MKVSYDDILNILVKYTKDEPESKEAELGEQDAAAGGASSSGGGGGYPTVTKWLTGVKRGKANPLMSKDEPKWTTGLTRGKANTLL